MGRPGLTHHRKFRRLARAIGGSVVARGSLELLWDACYEAGVDYLGDSDDIEAAAQWQGDPGVLTAALLSAGGESEYGFIEEIHDRPGHYLCHDLYDHAPEYVRKRFDRESERKARGVTLAEIRSTRGKKAAAARWGSGALGNQVDAQGLPVSSIGCLTDATRHPMYAEGMPGGTTPSPSPSKEPPIAPEGETPADASQESEFWLAKLLDFYPRRQADKLGAEITVPSSSPHKVRDRWARILSIGRDPARVAMSIHKFVTSEIEAKRFLPALQVVLNPKGGQWENFWPESENLAIRWRQEHEPQPQQEELPFAI